MVPYLRDKLGLLWMHVSNSIRECLFAHRQYPDEDIRPYLVLPINRVLGLILCSGFYFDRSVRKMCECDMLTHMLSYSITIVCAICFSQWYNVEHDTYPVLCFPLINSSRIGARVLACLYCLLSS